MNRKEFIFKSSVSSGSLLLGNQLSAKARRNVPFHKFSSNQFLSNFNLEIDKLRIQQLGAQFIWGVANAAFQVEGATQIHNKLPSIWDEFSHQKGKIKNGDSADRWFIVNEPAAFKALGYLSGYHAPGKKSPFNYLKTVHYVCLSIAEAGRLLRVKCPQKKIGIAYSYSVVHGASPKDTRVVTRVDAFLNRLFVEPSLGLGYPEKDLPVLQRLKNYFEPGDDELLKFDFDFVGVQYYFRVVVGKSVFIPFFGGREIPASKRGVAMNSMQREIYPEGLYDCLLRFKNYGFPDIVVSENGICYRDQLKDGEVVDTKRIEFFQAHLDQLVRAKNEGIPINGYFVWSLTDNFEWSEGYNDRFGIVYIDYPTQQRIIKHSGQWWQRLLVVPSQ